MVRDEEDSNLEEGTSMRAPAQIPSNDGESKEEDDESLFLPVPTSEMIRDYEEKERKRAAKIAEGKRGGESRRDGVSGGGCCGCCDFEYAGIPGKCWIWLIAFVIAGFLSVGVGVGVREKGD